MPADVILQGILNLSEELRRKVLGELRLLDALLRRATMPADVILQGILNLDGELRSRVLSINNLMKVLLDREAMPDIDVLDRLGNLDANHEIFMKPGIVRVILEYGLMPTDTILERLVWLYDCHYWFFGREKFLRVVLASEKMPSEYLLNILKNLGMNEFPNKDVLQAVVDLPLEHGIFRKSPGVLRVVLSMSAPLSMDALNGLGNLDDNHEIFRKLDIVRVILKYGLLVTDNILGRLVWMLDHHYYWIFWKEKFLRMLLAMEVLPSDVVLKGLGGLGKEYDWIWDREDVLELILRWGMIPSKDLLKVLRNQEVTRLLLENGNLRLSDKISEGLVNLSDDHKIFIRQEILRAVLGMDEFPNIDVLQAVVDLPLEHGIFRKSPGVLRVVLSMSAPLSMDALNGLGNLDANHEIFRKLDIVRVILKYGLIVTDNILGRLVWLCDHYYWIFWKEKFLRMLLDLEALPTDSVLDGLRELPVGHQIFQNLKALRRVLDMDTMPSEEELQELIRNTPE
jgi:hypothetical protein